MSWANPLLLALALVLPVVVAVGFALHVRRRRRAAVVWADSALLPRLGGRSLARVPWARAACVLPAAALIGIAAAGPLWGRAEARGGGPPRDVVLVLDASNSMLAADVRPNRLEQERALAGSLLRALPADRVGLVVFAGRGYIVSPLTTDHRVLQLYVDGLDPNAVAQGGSSVQAALRQAASLLLAARSAGTIVLVSDGEALEEPEEVVGVAQRIGRAGVAIHTVMLGTRAGAPVPNVDPATGTRRGWKREPNGSVAISRADPELLRRIAEAGGGTFHAAPTATAVVENIRGSGRGSGSQTGGGRDQGSWFLAGALLLLGVDAALERRR